MLTLSWWLGENIEERVRGDVRNALETVHQTTARSVDDWLTETARDVGAWARSPLVREPLTPQGPGRGRSDLLAPLSSAAELRGISDLSIRKAESWRPMTGSFSGERVTRELGEALIEDTGRSPDHAIVLIPDGARPARGNEVTFPRDIVVAAAVRDGGIGLSVARSSASIPAST